MAVPHSEKNPWVAMAVLSLGLFMTLLDVTIVNIATPQLIDGLHASLDQVLWVFNAYTLALAVLLITSGRLGDLFGPRNLFMAGMVLFTGASALCGLSQEPNQLIAARVLQGVGAALLTPQSIALVLPLFPPARRGAAFAINGIVAGVASVAGPILGGLIVTQWGWRWIFFVNLPVGVVALALTLFLVPDLRPGHRHRLDLVGVALATAALTILTYGLVEGQRYDWGTITGSITIPEVIGAGLALLIAFVVIQHFKQGEGNEPLIPFILFRNRNFALMNFVGGALQFSMVGLFLPFAIYFQSVLGLSALEAGLVLVPSALASMLIAPVAGGLVDKVGGKYILITGLALFGAGMAILDWTAQADSSRWSFLPGMVVTGMGMGCIFVPLFHVAMEKVPAQLGGAASGVINTTRQLGGVIGGVAVGALLQNRLAASLHERAVEHAGQLPEQFRVHFVDAFSKAARGGFEVGAGQTGASLQLPPGVPPQAIHQLQQIAHDVFTHAFVDAIRPTLLLPIAILALAALSCVAIKRGQAEAERDPASAPVSKAA